MNLSSKEQIKLIELLEELEAENTDYVILRSYEDLPEKIRGGDVDILASNTSKIVEKGKELGFSKEKISKSRNLVKVADKVIKTPLSAANTFFSKPRESVKVIMNKDVATPKLEKAEEEKIYYEDLMIHITDKIHYKSTLDNSRILASQKINQSLLDNSKTYEGNNIEFSAPSKADELCHLVARTVFEYDKTPEYYKNKINELHSDLEAEGLDRLEELLKEVFFDASELIISKIKKDEIDSIKEDLIKYSDY